MRYTLVLITPDIFLPNIFLQLSLYTEKVIYKKENSEA